MALYDEVRTIPYDTFDYKAECDKYDRASSEWDKFMQAAALAKFAKNNGDRGGEEGWLLRALYWADYGSDNYSKVAYALADYCDRYGVYISRCMGDDDVPTRMDGRLWRKVARGESLSDDSSTDSQDGSGPSAEAAAQVGAAASKGLIDEVGWGTVILLPFGVFMIGKFILDTYGDIIFGFLKTAGIVVAIIAVLFVITKFILPRFRG